MKKLTKASLALGATALAAAAALVTNQVGQVKNATAAPVNGGTITFGQAFAFQNEFLPYIISDAYTNQIWATAFDGLMTLDKNMNTIPWLAKSWKWSPDKKTVTISLQPKANWSDGKPITSDDVLLFMDYIGSKAYSTTLQGEYQSIVGPIKGSDKVLNGSATSFTQTGGFKKINDKTFSITMDGVDAAVLWSDIAAIVPLPSHTLKSIPFKDWGNMAYNKKPTVVDGAYTFTKVNGTDSVEMAANPHYWAGKPHIQNVIYKTVSADVAPGLLANGTVDFQLTGLKPQDVSKLKQIPNVNVVTEHGLTYYYLAEKMNKYTEFKDVRVRQAFEYAIDRNAMVKGIYKGYGAPLNGAYPSIFWCAASAKDGINTYNYNITKANQLLDAAGWKKGADGSRIDPRTGKKADLHLLYPIDPVREAISVAIKQNLAKVGINVTLDTPLDLQAFYKKVQNDDPSIMMYVAAWQVGTEPDPRGNGWTSDSQMNYQHWIDPKSDALIKDTYSVKAFDKNYRKQALVKFDKYINQQLPLNFLFQRDDVYALNNRVHIPANDWSVVGPLNLYQWWVTN